MGAGLPSQVYREDERRRSVITHMGSNRSSHTSTPLLASHTSSSTSTLFLSRQTSTPVHKAVSSYMYRPRGFSTLLSNPEANSIELVTAPAFFDNISSPDMFDTSYESNDYSNLRFSDKEDNNMEIEEQNDIREENIDDSDDYSERHPSGWMPEDGQLSSPDRGSPNQMSVHLDLELSDSEDSDKESLPSPAFTPRLKVKNVTLTKLDENEKNDHRMETDELNDVSNLKEKMKKCKPKNVNMKKTKYFLSSSTEDDLESDNEAQTIPISNNDTNNHKTYPSKEDKTYESKAKLSKGVIKQVLGSYSKFRAPLNLQYLGKRVVSEKKTYVEMSDQEHTTEFVMSNNSAFLLEHIEINSIFTINLVKTNNKKEHIICNFFINKTLQVGKKIGAPKKFKK